jgi:hypothetical protein
MTADREAAREAFEEIRELRHEAERAVRTINGLAAKNAQLNAQLYDAEQACADIRDGYGASLSALESTGFDACNDCVKAIRSIRTSGVRWGAELIPPVAAEGDDSP